MRHMAAMFIHNHDNNGEKCKAVVGKYVVSFPS